MTESIYSGYYHALNEFVGEQSASGASGYGFYVYLEATLDYNSNNTADGYFVYEQAAGGSFFNYACNFIGMKKQ